ncbi:putative lysophospholipase BODYGUARD 3 [Senna tora]|uniref:Putative lysophospholipase BODYGUARD 3 n=1 Tax=Senna tora TaxID=362788 RepID=A0A834WLU3_9FABA|nr:putative lysophospholipase BODYGUARD 3 [Senna tora]
MGVMRDIVAYSGRVMNSGVSLIVFCFLDVLDFVLCLVFKTMDLLIEGEWKGCYCSSSAKEAITSGGGNILVSEQGESKILSLTSSSSNKLQLEDISDTLYSRPSLLSKFSNHRLNLKNLNLQQDHHNKITVNSTIVEMLQGKIRTKHHHHHQKWNPTAPTWSDCDCKLCTGWINSCSKSNRHCNNTLFVSAPAAAGGGEAVVFIHGFISSSSFWTETLFPNFSEKVKSYRLFAVDLLGFGRSPKPSESLYTLREHLEMIEKSVLEAHNLQSFHIVAHSLGCILALALAVKYPRSVKSLTLLAPPFYPVPKGAALQPAQYVMRSVAPRRVWPPIALGASIACWYEHITRMVCLVICKNHRLWEFLTKLITRNRMRTFLMEGFFCHTHNAAWHTLHNIICGSAGKMEGYLDAVRDKLRCKVTVFHGRDDELIPLECSYELQKRVPRAHVRVIDNKDHITIVVGRQKAFARELEHIWTT